MAKDRIESKDVVDPKLVKTLDEINKELAQSVKLMTALTKAAIDLNKAFSPKNMQQVTESQKEYNKVNEESQKENKQAADTLEKLRKKIKDVNVEEEKAKIALQEKRKEIRENIKAQKDQTKETVKLNRELKKEVKTEKEATEQNKRLLKVRKDIDASTAKGAKQVSLINKRIDKNNALLKKNASQLGKQKIGIGEYERANKGLTGSLDKLKTGFAAFVGILAAGRVLIKGVKNIIASTQTTGDQFAITVEQIKIAYNAFNKAIASAELGDLLLNFRSILKVGKEYALLLDDLGDRQRGLTLIEAEASIETEKLKQVVDNVNLSNQERIKAAKRVLDIERELLTKRQSIRDQAFTAEAKRLEALTGLNRNQVISFIKNYDDEKAIREDAIAFIKEEDTLRKQISDNQLVVNTAFAQGNTKLAESFQNTGTELENQSLLLQQNVDDSVKAYSILFREYSKTTDEELDKVTETYKAFLDSQVEFYTGTRRAANQYNTILKQINKTNEKAIEVEREKSEITKLAEIDILETIGETNEKKLTAEEEHLIEIGELQIEKLQERNDAEKEVLDESVANQKTADENKAESFKAYVVFATNQAQQLANSIFAFQSQELANQLTMDVEKAKTRGASEEELRKIEKKAAEDRQDLAVKQALINGALGITNAIATAPSIIVGLILAAVVAATTAINIASIRSQKFAKGTTDSGSEWLNATVGEKGTERINFADGRSMLTPNGATQMYLPPHSEVVPNHTLQRELAQMQMHGKSSRFIQEEEDRKRKEENDRIIKAINNRDETTINITEGGFSVIARKGSNFTKYLDRKYRA